MFEWLDSQLETIRWRNFHLINSTHSPPKVDLRSGKIRLPDSYCAFIEKYGDAKLFLGQSGFYKLEVYQRPKEAISQSGTRLINFGCYDGNQAYFKECDLDSDPFVYESGPKLRKVAENFEQWLYKRGLEIEKKLGKEKWKEIHQGPRPFTPKELRIIDARNEFFWKAIGINDNGNICIGIKNNSSQCLPYLTIGVKRVGGPIIGRAWVKVGDILPGEFRKVEKDCYKKWVNPKDVELYSLPNPTPEERELYWEFKPDLVGDPL